MKQAAFLLCVALTASAASAQTTPKWAHYSFSTTPECMIQDGQYLWIGTDGGLVRFDRIVDTFYNFYPSNSGLPIAPVTALTRAKDGAIWITTRGGGVARYAGGVWSKFTPANSPLPAGSYSSIAADSLGRIWIGTGYGLVEYDNGIWTTYTTSNTAMLSNVIYSIAADRVGNIWVATEDYPQVAGRSSFLKFDGGTNWELHDAQSDPGFDVNTEIYSILVAQNGDLWLGTEGYVDRVQSRQWTSVQAVPGSPNFNYVKSLAEDAQGRIVATDGYGAGIFDGTSWTSITNFPFTGSTGVVVVGGDKWFCSYANDTRGHERGIAKLSGGNWLLFDNLSNCPLTNNWLVAMTMDSKGRAWFGERVIGASRVSMFDGSTWSYFDTLTGPDVDVVGENCFVMSLCADSSGSVYIGTCRNGVVKFDGTTSTRYDLSTLINHSNVVSALAYDSKRNVLWIGTQWQGSTGLKSGLVRFDGTTWSHWEYGTSPLPEAEISSLAVDPNGGVWVATWYAGIAHFDGASTWDVYSASSSAIPSDQVFKVDQAPNGDIWIATLNGGAKWNGAMWTPFTNGNSGIIANVATCAVDRKGNVWFGAFNGTGEGGACEFDGSKWTMYTPSNSEIGSNLLENIMCAANGDVWFETYDIGIIRYNSEGFSPPCLSKSARVGISTESGGDTATLEAGALMKGFVTIQDTVLESYGLTTVTANLQYDARTFTLKSVRALNGWTLAGSQDVAGAMQLTLTSPPHAISPGEQILEFDLSAFVGVVQKGYATISDTHFNPSDPKFENCTLASLAQDTIFGSVANVCGDGALRTYLNNRPIWEILSVSPDPVPANAVGAKLSIGLSITISCEMRFSVASVTGQPVLAETRVMEPGSHLVSLDLPAVANGVYVISVESGSTRQIRKVIVQ